MRCHPASLGCSWVVRLETGATASAGQVVLTAGVAALLLFMPLHEVLVRLWPRVRVWDEAVVVVLALALAAGALARRRFPAPHLLLPMTLMVLIGLCSALANGNLFDHGLAGLRALFPYMIAAIAAAEISDRRVVRNLLLMAVTAGGAVALYGVASYVAFRLAGGPYHLPPAPRSAAEAVLLYPYFCGAYPVPDGWRLISTVMNDNYCGNWLAMLAPLTLTLAWERVRRVPKLLLWGVAVVSMVALAWTYSRAAFLALAVGVAVHTMLAGRRFLPGFAAVGVVFLLALPVFALQADVHRFTDLQRTARGRGESIREALAIQQERPLTGAGPGAPGVFDVHYARIAWQYGVPGLAAFLWLLVAAASPGLRPGRVAAVDRAVTGALVAGMAALGAAALGGDVWEVPQLAYLFWIMAGSLYALTRAPEVLDC